MDETRLDGGEEGPVGLAARAPPPRPARRDAAIEAALRKFDGVEELTASVPERARPRGWIYRPQAAMLVTATASSSLSAFQRR